MRNKLHISDSAWSSRDTSLRCVRVYGNQSVSYCVYLGEYYRVCGCMETRLCHTVFIWVNIILSHNVYVCWPLGIYIYHTIRHRACVLMYVVLGHYTISLCCNGYAVSRCTSLVVETIMIIVLLLACTSWGFAAVLFESVNVWVGECLCGRVGYCLSGLLCEWVSVWEFEWGSVWVNGWVGECLSG